MLKVMATVESDCEASFWMTTRGKSLSMAGTGPSLYISFIIIRDDGLCVLLRQPRSSASKTRIHFKAHVLGRTDKSGRNGPQHSEYVLPPSWHMSQLSAFHQPNAHCSRSSELHRYL